MVAEHDLKAGPPARLVRSPRRFVVRPTHTGTLVNVVIESLTIDGADNGIGACAPNPDRSLLLPETRPEPSTRWPSRI